MKQPLWLVLIEVVLLSFTAAFSYANAPLKYNLGTSGSSIPYENAVDEDRPGIMVELLPLIMNKAGLKTEKVMLSTKRAMLAFNNGELDFDFFSPGWVPLSHSVNEFSFTSSIITVTEYFVTLPQNARQYEQRKDIDVDTVVGTVEGYVYFDEHTFTPLAFQSESALVLALRNQRVDVVIMEEAVARYWSAKHGVPIKFGAIHTQGPLALRLHNRHKDKIERLNKAINTLKASGEIQAVLDKYDDFSI